MNSTQSENSSSDFYSDQAQMLVNRIKKNQRRFKSWIKNERIKCYRLYNYDIPEIPLCIDWYDGRLHISVLEKANIDQEWVSAMADFVRKELQVLDENCFVKLRKKGKGGSTYSVLNNKNAVFEVEESDFYFLVNLSDYLDTGLFLDHRITRALVEKEAKGKKVLNLFAYTGTFSVYAARGGALSTTTVDLSNTYLDVAQRNMQRAGFGGEEHSFLKYDVLKLLEHELGSEKFDLVILDPPTVSKSKAMEKDLVIGRDYGWMINAILQCLNKGGIIYFSTNFKGFKMNTDIIKAHKIEDITNKTIPMDFANKRPHRCFRIEK